MKASVHFAVIVAEAWLDAILDADLSSGQRMALGRGASQRVGAYAANAGISEEDMHDFVHEGIGRMGGSERKEQEAAFNGDDRELAYHGA